MALHACPNCTMTQEISIVELLPHFSIYLSRHFTTQIGRYIASYRSYMFFRKRYFTKTSIRVEPLALNHLETYTPSPINMSCRTHKEDEGYTSHEYTTPQQRSLVIFQMNWPMHFNLIQFKKLRRQSQEPIAFLKRMPPSPIL